MAISRFHVTTLGLKPSGTVDKKHKILLGLWRVVGGALPPSLIKKITLYLIDKNRTLDLKR